MSSNDIPSRPAHVARHGFPLATFQLRFAQWWQSLLADLAQVAAEQT